MIKAVVFDFGGVLAEEGFKEGIKALARKMSLNPDIVFRTADELMYKTGYVLGMSNESAFWNALRQNTGIIGSDKELRKEILKRFKLRTDMIKFVQGLKASGMVTAILSDQTNWLDEINQKTPFYHHFDYIFNSFKLKKGKRDPSVFIDVCNVMGFKPEEVLFVDDRIENIKRAKDVGLKTLHFIDVKNFEKEISREMPHEVALSGTKGMRSFFKRGL
jgi:putative hydrolase of the HAD superfamily